MGTEDRKFVPLRAHPAPAAKLSALPGIDAQLRIAELRRLAKVKAGTAHTQSLLGGEVVAFFKKGVQRRHTHLGKIAERFEKVVPEMLLEHCAIESLHRGTLTVICDSSPHLFDLKTLLLAGLEKQLLAECRSAGLRKIMLKPGRWYQGDGPDRRISF